MAVHIKTDDGADHIVKFVGMALSGDHVGEFLILCTCCTELRYMTPEEFAMSYYIKRHAHESRIQRPQLKYNCTCGHLTDDPNDAHFDQQGHRRRGLTHI